MIEATNNARGWRENAATKRNENTIGESKHIKSVIHVYALSRITHRSRHRVVAHHTIIHACHTTDEEADETAHRVCEKHMKKERHSLFNRQCCQGHASASCYVMSCDHAHDTNALQLQH